LAVAREVGVNLEPVHIADDQQRRIVQVLTVAQQLLIRAVEVLVLALVLPAEVPAHPDVSPALAAVVLRDAPLERVPRNILVDVGGFRLPQQIANVEKVLLTGGPLGQRGVLPLGNEFLRRHSRRCHSRRRPGESESDISSQQRPTRPARDARQIFGPRRRRKSIDCSGVGPASHDSHRPEMRVLRKETFTGSSIVRWAMGRKASGKAT